MCLILSTTAPKQVSSLIHETAVRQIWHLPRNNHEPQTNSNQILHSLSHNINNYFQAFQTQGDQAIMILVIFLLIRG